MLPPKNNAISILYIKCFLYVCLCIRNVSPIKANSFSVLGKSNYRAERNNCTGLKQINDPQTFSGCFMRCHTRQIQNVSHCFFHGYPSCRGSEIHKDLRMHLFALRATYKMPDHSRSTILMSYVNSS